MFVAHLPAAYLVFRRQPRVALAAGLVGGVAPDFDLLWFYLVDNRLHHHHEYLTHRPALWGCVLAASFLLGQTRMSRIFRAFALGALLHLLLDSVTGQIAWAWPVSNAAYPLVNVPSRYDFWILNFLTHWTFFVEIPVTLAALALWQKKNPGRSDPGSSIP